MTKNNIISIGLDLSLTGTGVVVLKNGKIIKQKLIKSKPAGDNPVDELKRILKIINEIELVLSEELYGIAVIEGLAFMVRNATALVQLSALNYMIRAVLLKKNIPFIIVAPTSLKKFITGDGKSKKDVILMEVYKRYGVTIFDDNEADAYGLAQIGLALLGGNTKKTTAKQNEVIKLLSKQL